MKPIERIAPRTQTITTASLLAALCLTLPASVSAHPNNYPFDYDPSLSEDPTGIPGDLEDLHNSLPGLPDGLVEIEMDGIAFNYFPEVLDMIQRARDSGPQIAPPMQRTPQLCVQHDAFSIPPILIQPASSNCLSAGQQVYTALANSFDTCEEVEFPEVYVLDHPPAVVDANFLGDSQLLSTLEGQIALIGEALSHLDYPVGLMPLDFWPLTRSVIAKIRYQTLSDNIDARLVNYAQAKQRLQSSASCFHANLNVSLQSDIDDLVTELTAVGAHLDQVHADGLVQAAADRQAVENQGRLRNDLPHPSLTDHEREMLAFYLGAVYWRMRGGGLIRNPANGTVPDITYVTNIFEGIARFTGGLSEAETVGFNYAIDESYGYQEWWDLGNDPGHDQYYDLLWMTDRGRRGVGLVTTTIGNLGYDIKNLVAGGLIMGPCYYYMWYELWARNGRYFQLGEDLVTPYFYFLEMPYSNGEACYGSAMALGLARTLLWGTPNPDCQVDCEGAVCGDNGCGGSCGSCSPGTACDEGMCVACEADCSDSTCGDDGCGGSCGSCEGDLTCEMGECVAPVDCTGDECPLPPPPSDPSEASCGCSSAPASGHVLVLLFVVALFRRRSSPL